MSNNVKEYESYIEDNFGAKIKYLDSMINDINSRFKFIDEEDNLKTLSFKKV